MDRLAARDLPAQTAGPAEFFDWLADAYLILDQDGRIVSVNQRCRAVLGGTGADLASQSVYDLNAVGSKRQRELRARWLDSTLARLAPGQTRASPAFRLPLADARGLPRHTRYWTVEASLIGPGDAPGGYVALRLAEVTAEAENTRAERRDKARLRSRAQLRAVIAREAQQKLEESRADLAQALSLAKIGAWQLDMATGEIVCTEQCKFNMGIGADEKLSETRLFTEIIHPDDRARVGAELTDALATHRNYEAEYRLGNRPDCWVLAGGRARYDASGAPVGMSGFTLDITARKQAELAQQQLASEHREAREESDRNALAMDHFLTTVSHELRSPIGVILNWAALMRRPLETADRERASATLERNARQLSLMVDDLLDSGAIVSGKLSIHATRLSLDQLVTDVVNDLKPGAGHKGLELRLAQVDAASIDGDEARVKQIVWNLITNAIKFCDAGYVEVQLTSGHGEAKLQVRDTGCGIEPDAIARVFERFEQVRRDGATRVGGLGLGLWLVRNLVERHGGRVEAHSAGAGRGATFSVYLPLAH